MKKMVALTLALLMAASLFLSGCSVRKDTSDSENSGSSNGSGSGDRVVNVCSWGEYIDESLIDQFEEATGIKVNYQTAESNEVLYSQLSMGGVDYDVIVPSDYMISQLIEEDMLAELNYDNIPNFEKIDDRFKNLSYDPENKYTVPYTWGTLGIIYNTAKVQEPITSWSAMFDPQYAGNVLLINNSRDALGIALLYLGYSVNTTDEAEIQEAYQLIADAVKNGVYQGKVMDEVFQKMEGGNAAIATYYAGDYLSMLENNEDLAYVVPEEGSNWFSKPPSTRRRRRPGSTLWPPLRQTCGIWTISGTPLPTLRRWRPILPTMRRPTESPWIPLSMRSWPPPRRCWTGVRPTWSSLLRRAPSITTSGRNSVSEL